MQRFAVIGLGRFGSRLATNLAAMGQEVIGIDKDRRLIEELRDRVTLAIQLDATDEEGLRAQGIDQVDVAVIGIGDSFEACVLVTAILKQMGIKKVIGRAITPVAGQILKRIGADEVVNPEDESADRWSTRLMSPHFLNQYELDSEHSIVEVRVPQPWQGKTLLELRPRSEFDLHVLAIKHETTDDDGVKHTKLRMPAPDQPLEPDHVLVVMGTDEALSHVPGES